MSPTIRLAVLICVGLFIAASAAVTFLGNRDRKSFWIEVVLALVVAAVVLMTPSEIAFGDNHFLGITSAMFAAIVVGMLANYVFNYNRGSFDLLSFLKPVCVSPIVLLPLIGSIDQTGSLSTLQTVSIMLLAFQNGFFWKTVFDRVQSSLAGGKN